MKLYNEFAPWWPLISSPSEYVEEAGIYDRLIRKYLQGDAKTMLELGSGGGNNASYLKRNWAMTLVDQSEAMLKVSKELNPMCQHHLGDMRTVRLGLMFDAVFIHDAIDYMISTAELEKAFQTALLHLRSGGVLLVAPDHILENFCPSTECGGRDGPNGAIRYLEWCYDPDPDDQTVTTDYTYVLRKTDGSVQLDHDRHIHGLFPRQAWVDALMSVGFARVHTEIVDHSQLAPNSYEAFIAMKS